jgi:hypothetical protein
MVGSLWFRLWEEVDRERGNREKVQKEGVFGGFGWEGKGISDGWGGEGAEKEERDLVIPG